MEQATFDYQECFKNIYYYLYSNSNTSRAERIVSDITKVLLCKLMMEEDETYFIDGMVISELLDKLRVRYPQAFEQFDDFSFTENDLIKLLDMLANISLKNAPSHIVGDAFQAIIGPTIRGDKGQFFTPKSLVECMIKIIEPRENEVVMDPACGTGGFLTEAFSFVYGSRKGECNSTYIGIDKDKDMSDLTLAVTEILTEGHSKVYNFNSLELVYEQNAYNMLLNSIDVILTNPPFGAKIGITDKKILEAYEFGHNWAYSSNDEIWYRMNTTVKSQDPQVLFIELCVKLLKIGGRMGIVLPEGVFGNKSLGYIWEYLNKNGNIIAMLDCPRNTFQPSTDTKTNVLIYEKGAPKNSKSVWIAVAKTCGHDRRGRSTNTKNEQLPNDFELIGDEYKKRNRTSIYWKMSSIDGAYFVPRYFENRVIMLEYQKNESFVSLGEMIEKKQLIIHSGHEVGSEAYGTGPIPFIRTSDIINFEISSDPTNSVSEEIYNRYAKQQNLQNGDVLFIADGRYRIGKSAIINQYNFKCIVQSHIDILSLQDNAPLKPYEFFYILNSKVVQDQIRSLIFIQSTLGTLGSRIREIQIPLPRRTKKWEKEIHAFQENIEMRAKMLSDLSANQYSYEL